MYSVSRSHLFRYWKLNWSEKDTLLLLRNPLLVGLYKFYFNYIIIKLKYRYRERERSNFCIIYFGESSEKIGREANKCVKKKQQWNWNFLCVQSILTLRFSKDALELFAHRSPKKHILHEARTVREHISERIKSEYWHLDSCTRKIVIR